MKVSNSPDDLVNDIQEISYNTKGAEVTVRPGSQIRCSYKQGHLTGASNARGYGQFKIAIDSHQWKPGGSDAPDGDSIYRPFVLLRKSGTKIHLPFLGISKKRKCADYVWGLNKRIWAAKEFSDLCLVSSLDEGRFHVHKCVLSQSSSHFYALFHRFLFFDLIFFFSNTKFQFFLTLFQMFTTCYICTKREKQY